MESRLLSRATAFAAVPHVRKPTGRDGVAGNACSTVPARPIGGVGEGANLIWGRQLRPALLLKEASPVPSLAPVTMATRREILRPCLAASSSPAGGSDSAG